MAIASPDIDIKEHELIASICRESFYEFVQEFWYEIESADPVWNWHIEYICDELQYVAERVLANKPKEYNIIINVPPGSTKSMLCSIMFPSWVWTIMPHAQFIGGSYTDKLAMYLSLRNRDLVLSEKYRRCFGVNLRADQSTKSHFKNTKGGFRYSVGVGGSVMGMHGHFLIVDDPLNPEEARSETELETANRWMKSTLPTRKVDKEVTPMILIMQRLHQNDPTGAMLERAEKFDLPVKHICIPGKLTSDNQEDVQPSELKRFYDKDGLFDPIRLNHKALKELEAQGIYHFAGQIQQNPMPAGGGMFKTDLLNITSVSPKRWKRVCRYWDKAGTADDGAFTVGAKLGRDKHDRYWILDIVRGQWGSFEREMIIRRTAEMDGTSVEIGIEQEPGSGGKESAENTIRSLSGFRVYADKPTGDKIHRADPFAAQVGGGNVWMVAANWNAALIDEMKFFPDSKYKDQVDALSGAFNRVCINKRVVGAIR